jgi:hypothetical protein
MGKSKRCVIQNTLPDSKCELSLPLIWNRIFRKEFRLKKVQVHNNDRLTITFKLQAKRKIVRKHVISVCQQLLVMSQRAKRMDSVGPERMELNLNMSVVGLISVFPSLFVNGCQAMQGGGEYSSPSAGHSKLTRRPRSHLCLGHLHERCSQGAHSKKIVFSRTRPGSLY